MNARSIQRGVAWLFALGLGIGVGAGFAFSEVPAQAEGAVPFPLPGLEKTEKTEGVAKTSAENPPLPEGAEALPDKTPSEKSPPEKSPEAEPMKEPALPPQLLQANYLDPDDLFSISPPKDWFLHRKFQEDRPFLSTTTFAGVWPTSPRAVLAIFVRSTPEVQKQNTQEGIPPLSEENWEKYLARQLELSLKLPDYHSEKRYERTLWGFGKIYIEEGGYQQGSERYSSLFAIFQNRAFHYWIWYALPLESLDQEHAKIVSSLNTFKPRMPFLGIPWTPSLVWATSCALFLGVMGIFISYLKRRRTDRLRRLLEGYSKTASSSEPRSDSSEKLPPRGAS